MKKLFLIFLCLSLSACQRPGQGRYGEADVGQAATVEFGTVISMKQVDITGRNTGAGALIGGATGLGAGSYIGSGSGRAWGQGGGMLAGMLVGALVEQALSDHKGVEYIITFTDGKTRSIVQHLVEGDAPIGVGQRVMVQTQGQYQRVMPAQNLPTKIKRPKKIKVTNDCAEIKRPSPDFIGPMPVDCN